MELMEGTVVASVISCRVVKFQEAELAAERHSLWQEQHVLSSRWMEVRSGW